MNMLQTLRLNLQFFSADNTGGGEGGTTPTEPTEPEEPTEPSDSVDPPSKTIPYDRFKEVNERRKVLEEQLAEVKRQKEADETERLEEQNEYKQLYEQAVETIATKEADALQAKKETALVTAGYTPGQATRYLRFVEGETDEDVLASIETLKADIPPKQNTYADPSVNNGAGGVPSNPEPTELGRTLLQRALGKDK